MVQPTQCSPLIMIQAWRALVTQGILDNTAKTPAAKSPAAKSPAAHKLSSNLTDTECLALMRHIWFSELTCAATIVSASHCVGLTLPGMMELPGSFSGSSSSPSPHLHTSVQHIAAAEKLGGCDEFKVENPSASCVWMTLQDGSWCTVCGCAGRLSHH